MREGKRRRREKAEKDGEKNGKERRRGRELLILAWISLKTEGRKKRYLVSELQK